MIDPAANQGRPFWELPEGDAAAGASSSGQSPPVPAVALTRLPQIPLSPFLAQPTISLQDRAATPPPQARA